jgi:hypothetical protein
MQFGHCHRALRTFTPALGVLLVSLACGTTQGTTTTTV